MEISTSVLNVKKDNYVHTFYNLETAKTDYFHIDVMDGKFVENNTAELMREYAVALSHITTLGLDVHLMVENVEEFIDEYIDLEPRIITFHIEAVKDKERILNIIDDLKSNNIRVGLAINPASNLEEIKEYLPLIHMVLVMTVVPGKGGQALIPETLEKIKELKKYITENNIDIDIEADGGIKDINVKDVVDAGANIIVAGSYIVNAENSKEAIEKLKNI